ncbi:hypothetical protein ACLB2K_037901 [Fragaria x ananassa]
MALVSNLACGLSNLGFAFTAGRVFSLYTNGSRSGGCVTRRFSVQGGVVQQDLDRCGADRGRLGGGATWGICDMSLGVKVSYWASLLGFVFGLVLWTLLGLIYGWL